MLYLSQIGGLSVPDNARKILSVLFTDDLAKLLTMKGSSRKYAFEQLHLKQILIGKLIFTCSHVYNVLCIEICVCCC